MPLGKRLVRIDDKTLIGSIRIVHIQILLGDLGLRHDLKGTIRLLVPTQDFS
jgi:hypothetical protein